MKHKYLTFLIAMLMSMAASVVYASYNAINIDGIYYELNRYDKVATITYYGEGEEGDDGYYESYYNCFSGAFVVPQEVSYGGATYTVTSIGNYAFKNCTGLTSVTIPNSVTSIGYQAFTGCSCLTSVTIPNSVTEIGSSAFEGCSGLISVTIPDGVTSIGDYAFYGCTGLISVTIPNSITSIDISTFYECTGLTSVTIPESVTSIGSGAFNGCSGLTSLTIPKSVTSIGGQAFHGCGGLTSVTIPESVSSIGFEAFSGTPWYDNQPDVVVYVGKVAYTYKGTMPSNTTIKLEDGTTGIAGNAFYNQSNLSSITIPESVTSIGTSAFYGCI